MTGPPWGHKPLPVGNVMLYWLDQPPEPSDRCLYWRRRYSEGSWSPNRWLARQDNHGRALWLGVYIWEAVHVLGPLINEHCAGVPAGIVTYVGPAR